MKIFLIGFMGCGKSTLGKKLAKKLDFGFIDLDKRIEEKTGMSIAAYFDKFGEQSFREAERSNLRDTEYPRNTVISTGGGLPCYTDNMDWMNKNGTTIYISLPPQALSNRLLKGREDRPLIRHLNNEELLKFITDKLAEREPFYRRSGYILDGIDLTAEKIAGYLQSAD